MTLEEKIKFANSLIEKVLADDPIRRYIKDQGFDPDDGDLLLLPFDFEPKIEHSNVKYHRLVECPCLIKCPKRYIKLEEVFKPALPKLLLIHESCT